MSTEINDIMLYLISEAIQIQTFFMPISNDSGRKNITFILDRNSFEVEAGEHKIDDRKSKT